MPSEQFGCLYVQTGYERKTAESICQLYPSVRALAVEQLKHQSRGGVKSVVNTVLLPGYVLFQAEADFEVRLFYRLNHTLRLLRYDDRSWGLRGDDRSFALWVYQQNGLIGLSKAYREGTIVRITEGPLKDVSGQILRVDSRNRNAKVSFGFDKQVFTAWLAFEWMEDINGEALLKQTPQETEE